MARLRSIVPTLSRGPARVGERILADPGGVVPMTIQQLGADTGTSDASVMRLAKAVGCSGYRDLRTLLAASLAAEAATGSSTAGGGLPADITVDDTPAAVVAKLAAEEQQALADTAAALSLTDLGAAADAAATARRIVVIGIGASGLVAQDLSAKLERIGLLSQAVTEGHAAMTLAVLLTPVDLLVVVSASGETRDVLEPLTVARDRGVRTAAITVRPCSSVTVADHVLIGAAARESGMRSAAMSSRTGQLFVVDALFTLVFQRHFDSAGAAISASHRMLAPRRRGKGHA